MQTTVTAFCVEYEVEFSVCGQNRAATFYEPAEYAEVEIESVSIANWDLTDYLQQRVLDEIKREVESKLEKIASDERAEYEERRAEELAEMRMLGEAA